MTTVTIAEVGTTSVAIAEVGTADVAIDLGGVTVLEVAASVGSAHPDLATHDALGIATDAEMATHAAAADPHAVYQKESEKAAASGYASLDAGVLVPFAQLGAGSASGSKFLRDDRSWAVPAGGALPDGIFNVLAYGALGDGVADDTAEIQAAITAAGETPASAHRGGTVFFPRGAYLISAPLVIPSFVRLTGPGRPWHSNEITGGDPAGYYGADIFAAGGLNFHMFTNSDVVNGNTGIQIDNLRLDQRGVTGDNDIMRFTGLWRSYFRDINFVGATGTTNQRGLYITSGEENRVFYNRYDACGIRYVGNSLTALHNDIGAFGIYGMELVNGFGNRIAHNHIYNTEKDGIWGDNLVRNTFIDNHIEDCDWHGMYFKRSLSHSIIEANICCQNSRASAGARNGITLDSDTAASPSVRNLIRGNQCVDEQGSPTQGHGIYLESFSGTQTNDNVIEGNNFFGNTVAGFGQKAGLSNIVRGNQGHRTENQGATSVADGGTIAHGLVSTPSTVRVTPSVSGEFVSVTARGATTFTCSVKKHDNTAGTTQTVYWEAQV